jgi:hypothetical protein
MATKTAPRQPKKSIVKPAATSAPKPLPQSPVKTDASAAFLREVDEALKADRLLNLWYRFRWILLGAAASLIVAVAAWQAYGAWRMHQARSEASRWYDLAQLESEADLKKEIPLFIEHSHGGYQALARLAQAGLASSPEEKISIYMTIADDTQLPDWLRGMGRLNAALLLLNTDQPLAKAQLELLAQTDPTKPALPTYAPALDILAMMAMEAKDYPTAKAYTQKLLEQPQLTPAMRQRALQRMGSLS